jgi:IS1 family transposase
MNILRQEKKEAVIAALVEGVSIRSTERMTVVHRDTIMRLMVRVGHGCANLMNSYMQWVFVALDAESKLIPSFLVGKRTANNAQAFIEDLSSRLDNRVQLSSDGLAAYITAVESAFGANVDYAQVVKTYEAEPIGPGRYSPPKVTGADRIVISGSPITSKISTSYIERQNLTMRMQMRRFTRLTNAFSKKLENLKAAVALHFAHYNFVRIHSSLRVTPAMEAGVTNHLWTIAELLEWSN